ncbi:MAG: hypothetical protein DRI86_13555 [Bacteroidetes bacterium]|nr:MAG: hypothetical protein DRI86_13555 [Bacteroidota bacterium]
MNKNIIFIILFLFSIELAANAQKVYTFDLQKAIDLALVENRNILNAQHDVVIAKKQVWETTAIGLPQVSTELKYQNMVDIPVTLMPAKIFDPTAGPDDYAPMKFGQQHSASFGFTASQLIFSGEYIVGLQASKTYQELSQKAALKSENDVIELVTKSYYTVLFVKENKNVIIKTLEDIQKTFDEIQKIYQVGMAEETDVNQIELNLITVKNSLSSIDRQITIAENILKFQIGIKVSDSIVLTDSLEYIFNNASLKPVMKQGFDINKNIDYQLLQTQKEISELSLKREKSTFLPTISAFYSHSTSGQTNNFDDYFNGSQTYYNSNIVGAGLKWNIFNSGSRYVKVQQAQLELAKMNNQEYILEQNLEFQMGSNKAKLVDAYETYLKEVKNKELAEKIYKTALTKFTNGSISSNELTQLNLQYFNSQSSFYSAMAKVLSAKAELDKILGNNIK